MRLVPAPIDGIGGAAEMALGQFDGLVLLTDGSVRRWGWGIEASPVRPLTGLSNGVQISEGPRGACILLDDGSMRCVQGRADAGAATIARVPGTDHIVQIDGNNETCALTNDGRVLCLDPAPQLALTPVMGLPEIVQVSGQTTHACAVARDGTVYCWGENFAAQLGNGIDDGKLGENPPARVLGLTDAIEVEVSYYNSCALRRDGSVWCWGANDEGQCGDGVAGASRATPVRVILEP